jgi:hypothetical protein
MSTSTGDAPLAWQRLGDALIRRRIDWHPRYRNRRTFCGERDIDYRLVFDIEHAKRTNFGRATILDIARAYAVTPESIDATLAGGVLEPVPETAAVKPSGMPPVAVPAPRPHAGDDDEAVVRAEVERCPWGSPGAVIFPSGIPGVVTEDAQRWDALAPLTSYEDLIRVIAFWRRHPRQDADPGHNGTMRWEAPQASLVNCP